MENETDLTANLIVTRVEKAYILRNYVGKGKLGETSFELSTTMGGATIIELDDTYYVLNIESLVRFAVDQENQRKQSGEPK